MNKLYANNKDVLDNSEGKKDFEDEITNLKARMDKMKNEFQPKIIPTASWERELPLLIHKAENEYERLAKANVTLAAKIPGAPKPAADPKGTPATAKGTPATAKETPVKPADSTAKKTETPATGKNVTPPTSAAGSKQQLSPKKAYAQATPETEHLTYYKDASDNAEAACELVKFEVEIIRDQTKLKKQQAFVKPLED